MSTNTKIIIAVITVAVLALSSMWGVFAPLFTEADAPGLEE